MHVTAVVGVVAERREVQELLGHASVATTRSRTDRQQVGVP
jgi:site-specific recombinase XerC